MSERPPTLVTSYRLKGVNGTRQMPIVRTGDTGVLPVIGYHPQHRERQFRNEVGSVAYVMLWVAFWSVIVLLGVSIALAIRLTQMQPDQLRLNCQMIPGVQNWSTCAYPER